MIDEIVLPKNTGAKNTYKAILKQVYLDQRDLYYFHRLIRVVEADCGLSFETAKKHCKQLDSLGFLRYVSSSLTGSTFLVGIFKKNSGGEIIPIDNLQEACKLIENQFADIVETDCLQIRKMNIQVKPSEMRFNREDVRVFNAKPIKSEQDEVLKSSFKHEKQSKQSVCNVIEKQLKNEHISNTTFLESK